MLDVATTACVFDCGVIDGMTASDVLDATAATEVLSELDKTVSNKYIE